MQMYCYLRAEFVCILMANKINKLVALAVLHAQVSHNCDVIEVAVLCLIGQ